MSGGPFDATSDAAHPGARAAPALVLDHLVVAAATLEAGVAWCDATLGQRPLAGGKHAWMATHNRVFSIGSARFPRAYLEIIAIDPDGPAPARPRWFGLDEAPLQRAIADGPRLIHWVARCADIEAAAAAFRLAGFDPGEVLPAERETPQGLLRWHIGVRADGRRLCDGALPTLIEWGDVHPSANLPPSGIALAEMTLDGVPDALRPSLGSAIGYASASPNSTRQLAPGRAELSPPPPLRAVLETPRGRVTLESPRLESSDVHA
ncbi:MAG: VOC family protein [Caldimonas sp.]